LTTSGGYEKGDCDGFVALGGLFVGDVIGFINGLQMAQKEAGKL
jgi:hypothetical protein